VLKRELRIKELAREGGRGTAEGRVVVFQEARLDDIRECKRRITHRRSRRGMRGISSSQQTHFIWDLCYSSPSHSLSLLELFSLISNHIAQWFFYENLLFFSEEIGLVLFMVTVETRETN
jgi:hypothetical protein